MSNYFQDLGSNIGSRLAGKEPGSSRHSDVPSEAVPQAYIEQLRAGLRRSQDALTQSLAQAPPISEGDPRLSQLAGVRKALGARGGDQFIRQVRACYSPSVLSGGEVVKE